MGQTWLHGHVQMVRLVWCVGHGDIDRPRSPQAKTNAAEANILDATSGIIGTTAKAKFRRSTNNTKRMSPAQNRNRKNVKVLKHMASPSYRRFGEETVAHVFPSIRFFHVLFICLFLFFLVVYGFCSKKEKEKRQMFC